MKRLTYLFLVAVCVVGVLALPEATDAVGHGANGRIAFDSDRTGDSEIWTMRSDGTDLKNISREPDFDDWGPAWSPDGQRLAWFGEAEEGDWEIFVANANGSNPVNVTQHEADDMLPHWSPDGSQIVFSSNRTGTWDIWMMDADGSNQRNLTNHPATDIQGVWSPDGKKIAFGSFRSGQADVWTMNANGTGLFNVTKSSTEDLSPSWSPNGKELLFDSRASESDDYDVFAIRPDGTGRRQLTTDPSSDDTWSSWSPDGTKVLFTSNRTYGGERNVWVMNRDGSGQTAITTSGSVSDAQGNWQPVHTFVDVEPMNVFHHNIESLAAVAITKGCNPPANTRYCPRNHTTRAQMAAFLNRALKLPAASKDYFTDDNGSVFEADINRLAEAGITKGCNPPANDRYCPDSRVTRGQMAAFLVRALKLPAASQDYFVDDTGLVFENDINRLAKSGITKGCNPPTNNRYCPGNYVTREQMAAFLVRALGLPHVP